MVQQTWPILSQKGWALYILATCPMTQDTAGRAWPPPRDFYILFLLSALAIQIFKCQVTWVITNASRNKPSIKFELSPRAFARALKLLPWKNALKFKRPLHYPILLPSPQQQRPSGSICPAVVNACWPSLTSPWAHSPLLLLSDLICSWLDYSVI